LSLYEGNGELVLGGRAGMLLWSTAAEPDALTRARSKLAGALDRRIDWVPGTNQYAWFLIAGDQGVFLVAPRRRCVSLRGAGGRRTPDG
jgi:hypothetical protein